MVADPDPTEKDAAVGRDPRGPRWGGEEMAGGARLPPPRSNTETRRLMPGLLLPAPSLVLVLPGPRILAAMAPTVA